MYQVGWVAIVLMLIACVLMWTISLAESFGPLQEVQR